MNEEGAMLLLEAMVRDSAEQIQVSASNYLDSLKDLEKAKKNMKAAMIKLQLAEDKRRNALDTFMTEYRFLNGEEYVKPMLDGESVVVSILKSLLETMKVNDVSEVLERGNNGN